MGNNIKIKIKLIQKNIEQNYCAINYQKNKIPIKSSIIIINESKNSNKKEIYNSKISDEKIIIYKR